MRLVLVGIAVALLLVESGGVVRPVRTTNAAPVTPARASESKARVDFDTQLKPIFQSKCMPCHFSGGKMYDKLPFDRPETIKRLGTKLFTRIHDENDRKLIREFLSQE